MGAFQKELFYVKMRRVNNMKESTEKTYQKIGENVYRFRVLERLSQAQLAEKSQMSAAYVSQIEGFRLHKGITCTAMINIAEALNVPTCVLLAKEPCQKYLECLQQTVIQADKF